MGFKCSKCPRWFTDPQPLTLHMKHAHPHKQTKPPRECTSRREGDENVCHCGARWGWDETKPPCSRT